MNEYDEICKMIDEINFFCNQNGIKTEIKKPKRYDSISNTLCDILPKLIKLSLSIFKEQHLAEKNNMEIKGNHNFKIIKNGELSRIFIDDIELEGVTDYQIEENFSKSEENIVRIEFGVLKSLQIIKED